METEVLKDAYGTVVGSIETDASGNQILRSTSGRIRAAYDVETDFTRDANGHVVAKGNALHRVLC